MFRQIRALITSTNPSLYLMYCDMNYLYEWAMCQPLSYAISIGQRRCELERERDRSGFTHWSFSKSISSIRIYTIDTDLPFCPTRNKSPGKCEDKFLATLYDKQRYIIHHRNLHLCTYYGLRVTNIHRMLQFAQSPWLREYIQFNKNFRTQAKNVFKKNLY